MVRLGQAPIDQIPRESDDPERGGNISGIGIGNGYDWMADAMLHLSATRLGNE